MLWTAFLLGFLGSFHCVGMCGPIAMAVGGKGKSSFFYHKILYNIGRSITYAILGLLVGSLGFSLSLVGVQQSFSIAIGLLILILALSYKTADQFLTMPALSGIVSRVKRQLSRFLKAGGSFAFLATGLANGLLPCGMVYMALVAALGLQSPLLGATYMFFFGIGTIPLLLGLMYSGALVSFQMRQKFQKAIPYIGALIGILFIVRGLGLGMFFSPDLQVFDYGNKQIEITMCR
ncbi:sulfite exporter TauE/SafE family protein [Algoriphagus persicinus]|uniref:sulfite exporter TauE/SafE family protein n=1 Tax=Algoriphagus persicinus TaxID=3108754 RepID=UPI002B3F49E1|nr:sulfite exporter TauE/SafE family protein [Algoriphagus sp. E1-3-M2]MEB2785688.1 sulfite exporter TauE/SafE family protein [Algoriphagus sp. E1-3-M2]